MKINLNVPGISPKEEDHYLGILRSLFVAVEDILDRKRRASYLIHFFGERLTKSERRKVQFILAKMITSLSERGTFESNLIESSSKEGSVELSRDHQGIITSFRRISKPTKASSSVPLKARDILKLFDDVGVKGEESNDNHIK